MAEEAGSRAKGDTPLVFSFEQGHPEGWAVVDGALRQLVSDHPVIRPTQESRGQHGRYYLSTCEVPGGFDDAQKAVVESPVIRLAGPDIHLLVAGGSRDVAVMLCALDGRVYAAATGQDDERFRPVHWSVPEAVGKSVTIRVVDQATGSFGHINVDQITLMGALDVPATVERRRRMAGDRNPEWLAGGTANKPANALVWDFETGDLQGWRVVSGSFRHLISNRVWNRNVAGEYTNKQGNWFLGTLELPDNAYDDTQTGVVNSPVFTLRNRQLSFLVGGGGGMNTYVALCTLDGREHQRASGQNSEYFHRVVWDVPELVGHDVYVRIVDQNTGGWGHVVFDDLRAAGTLKVTANVLADRSTLDWFRAQERLAARRLAERRRLRQRYASLEALTRRQASPPLRADRLEAVAFTVGGIGAGCLEMDGQARLRHWMIFNNWQPLTVPLCFLGMVIRQSGRSDQWYALQGAAEGPFTPMTDVSLRARYPMAVWTLTDREAPVTCRLDAWSPFVPMQLRDSAMPAGVFQVTITNTSARPVSVRLVGSLLNTAGYQARTPIEGRAHADLGGNRARLERVAGGVAVSMSGATEDTLMWSVTGDGRPCGWTQWREYNELAGQGHPNPVSATPVGQTHSTAVGSDISLAPNQSARVSFCLTWSFPRTVQPWGGEGNRYNAWWKDAAACHADLLTRLDQLEHQTRLYTATLYDSNLPIWMLDRISSQLAVLRSRTCFWSRSGYFGAWEGCGYATGCCAGNCAHVWHYAQGHARLFPELGRLMREQELGAQRPDGSVPMRQIPDFPEAFDGTCGAILGAYREHLCSADPAWIRGIWPKMRHALDHLIRRHDPDEDGMLTGPQHNTLDADSTGTSSWLGSLYLAALQACARVADMHGEADVARRYRAIFAKGRANQNRALFNGEYYYQITDPQPVREYGSGCHIDQVLGQWWADMLDLGEIYPADRVKSALAALYKYNYRSDFQGFVQAPRQFVAPFDGGMHMISWPRGGRPAPEYLMLYADEVMTGFEYSAASAMIYAGLLRQGLSVVRTVYDRYDGMLRTGLTPGDTASWGYSGNPFGDDECGKYYGRALSAWSLLLAAQGFVYDGPAGRLGFRPRWRPDDHRSFFSTAAGYGLFIQKRRGSQPMAEIQMVQGSVDLRELVLQPERPHRMVQVYLQADLRRQPVPCTQRADGDDLVITLMSPVELTAGSKLIIRW